MKRALSKSLLRNIMSNLQKHIPNSTFKEIGMKCHEEGAGSSLHVDSVIISHEKKLILLPSGIIVHFCLEHTQRR